MSGKKVAVLVVFLMAIAGFFVTDCNGDILVFKRVFKLFGGRIFLNEYSAYFQRRVIFPNLDFVGHTLV